MGRSATLPTDSGEYSNNVYSVVVYYGKTLGLKQGPNARGGSLARTLINAEEARKYFPVSSFLSPPVQIARWALMRRFLSVCLSVCLW